MAALIPAKVGELGDKPFGTSFESEVAPLVRTTWAVFWISRDRPPHSLHVPAQVYQRPWLGRARYDHKFVAVGDEESLPPSSPSAILAS